MSSVTQSAIMAGFEKFRNDVGIPFSGIDFDWEQTSDAGDAINKIGEALRPKYVVTAVPMSS